MTYLAIVPAAKAEPAPSTARRALSDHQAHIAAAQSRYSALRDIWDKMQAAKNCEDRCRSVLETQIRCEEEAVRAWTRDPNRQIPQADVFAREMNEAALANARRIADTIRAAEPEHGVRQTQALNELTALKSQLPALVDAVMLEEAGALRAALDATIALANHQSAMLFGLRSCLAERGAGDVAQTVPITQEMWPAHAAIGEARQRWQAYAERLTTFSEAKIEV